MSFVFALALGVAALVAAPFLAHRLRRERAEPRPFAPTRLVPATPPKARRRAKLEDRWLFAVRAAAIVALALLGATPLVRCSRLALTRSGASVAVAIVVDDSMSMRAETGGASRFARAKDGAREIVAGLRDGDAVAIVLAGDPARVALAATTDFGAAAAAVSGLTESDRGTDLDGALTIAHTLIGDLPQVDRRVVLLSDLADGHPDGPPVGEGSALPVWIAMPELRDAADDCGVIAADRVSARVRVRFACTTPRAAEGREITIRAGEDVLARTPLPQTQAGEVALVLTPPPRAGAGRGDGAPSPLLDDATELVAVLEGHDAIAADDRALVVVEAGPAAIAVASDHGGDGLATGGAPVIEQALAALHVDMAVRPLPEVPDRREDTAPFAAMFVDDPPGFTPEQRRALGAFVDGGGVLFVTLGRRASTAPLGANLEPALSGAVRWDVAAVTGVDPAGGALFGEATASLVDLAPRGRGRISEEDVGGLDVLLRWTDGAPFAARRPRGRGEIWLTTLPFSVEASDFALRPGFLAILDAFVAEARVRARPRRGSVGAAWIFTGAKKVEVNGPDGQVPVAQSGGVPGFSPPRIGVYRVAIDGSEELRIAAPLAREIDLRPRAAAAAAVSASQGGGVAIVDVSWMVALVLLALATAELVIRALTRPPREAI